MAMNISSDLLPSSSPASHVPGDARYRFVPDDDSRDPARSAARSDRSTAGREDLPYKVELWDEGG
jgi:hypothetical protein